MSFALLQIPFANFNMSIEEMQENLDLILDTLQEHKPRRKKDAKKPKVRNIKIMNELPFVVLLEEEVLTLNNNFVMGASRYDVCKFFGF